MTTTDTQLQQLVINVGTEEQITTDIEGGVITQNQLSLTTDGPEYITTADVKSTYNPNSSDPVNGQAIASALTTKQNVLVSGGNIKTINGQTLLGAGNINIEGGGGPGIVAIDDITITKNIQDEIQTEGIIEQNAKTAKFDWVGTLAQYEALEEYHNDWIYYITDDYLSGAELDYISITKNSHNDMQAIGVINQNNNTKAVKMWTGTEAEFRDLKEQDAYFGWTVNGLKLYTDHADPMPGEPIYDENLNLTRYVVQSATEYRITIVLREESGSES